LLLTIHLNGVPGFQASVLHLRREFDHGVFDQLAVHYEEGRSRASRRTAFRAARRHP
jgi:hypothetical protein